jgi:hypothetical protein
VDVDDAGGINFDLHALKLTLGAQSSTLSLTEEAVQLGEVMSAQPEPVRQLLARLSEFMRASCLCRTTM